MAIIIGIIIMLNPITSPTSYNVESDGIPFVGWMPEVVVTAPRYYFGGSDSAPFIGWMPEVLVTAKRYSIEEDMKIVRGNLSTLEDSNKSDIKIQSRNQEL